MDNRAALGRFLKPRGCHHQHLQTPHWMVDDFWCFHHEDGCQRQHRYRRRHWVPVHCEMFNLALTLSSNQKPH